MSGRKRSRPERKKLADEPDESAPKPRWLLPALLGALPILLITVLGALSRCSWFGHKAVPHGEISANENPIRAEALRLANEVAEDFPDAPEAWFVRGLILNRFGSSYEAVECWQQCLKTAPEFADAYHWIGWDALRRGRFDEAISMLSRAVELQPDLPQVRLRLAEGLTNTGRIEEAVDQLEAYVESFPGSTEGYFQLGQAYQRCERYEEAVAAFEHAIQIDPHCTFAWFGLAKAHARLGHQEQSQQLLQKFQQLKAEDFAASQREKREYDDEAEMRAGLADAYVFAARAYEMHGREAKMLQCLKNAARSDPRNVSSREQLFALYQRRNQLRQAVDVLRDLVAIEPENIAHALNLGVVLSNLKQYEQAEEVFRDVIKRHPGRSEGYGALSQLYVRSGKSAEQARRLAQQAIERDGTAANYYFLSAACAAAGDMSAAQAAIGQAVRLAPGNAQYREFQAGLAARAVGAPRP